MRGREEEEGEAGSNEAVISGEGGDEGREGSRRMREDRCH
jgi:hypothetical protein